MRPKEFKMCVTQRDNSIKDTRDVLTDLPLGPSKVKSFTRKDPELLLVGTLASVEDTARDEKRPHPYSRNLFLHLSPQGPILSSASTVNDIYQPTAPTVLSLREVLNGN